MTSNRVACKRALDPIVFRATLARSHLIAKRRFAAFGALPVIRGRVRCRMGGTASRRQPMVTKDIPPRCFGAGAPAQVVRKVEMDGDWIRRARLGCRYAAPPPSKVPSCRIR